jgi:hypothetical protein
MTQSVNSPVKTKEAEVSPGAIPTLEQLMVKLERAGLQKYAAEIRRAASILGIPSSGSIGVGHRPGFSKGRKPAPRLSEPGSPMLQEGDRYTEIDPSTGREETKRYQMQSPLPVGKLQPYFDKGMFNTDFFQREFDKETDPRKKAIFKRLLDMAEKHENELRGSPAGSKEAVHWLSERYDYSSIKKPSKEDEVEKFLTEAIKSFSDADRPVIQALLDKRKAAKGAVGKAVGKIASGLRAKGYEALARRVEAAGMYAPGKGVRIRSLKEYIEESKGKGDEDTSLFDQMFDKYARVLEGAAAIVKKAKKEAHDPEGLKDIMKVVLAADHLMMQKLLEIGEITQLTRGEGI